MDCLPALNQAKQRFCKYARQFSLICNDRLIERAAPTLLLLPAILANLEQSDGQTEKRFRQMLVANHYN